MPSFVARVERPDRGGEWVGYLEARERAAERWVARLGLDGGRRPTAPRCGCCTSTATRSRCSPRCSFEATGADEESTLAAPRDLSAAAERRAARRPRRPREPPPPPRPRASRRCATASRSSPTTAPSATSSATACSPCSGSAHARTSARACPRRSTRPACGDDVPPRAGRLARRVGAARRRRAATAMAPYALCLGYRIRYVLDLNAREAMQLIELRSGREGHPSYRAVAHEMHAQIAAVHPAVGAAMAPRRPRHRAAARAHPVARCARSAGAPAFAEPAARHSGRSVSTSGRLFPSGREIRI